MNFRDEARKLSKDGQKMKVLSMYGTLPSSEQVCKFQNL